MNTRNNWTVTTIYTRGNDRIRDVQNCETRKVARAVAKRNREHTAYQCESVKVSKG